MTDTQAVHRTNTAVLIACLPCLVLFTSPVCAQDLGPNFRKIKDGIYVQSSREVNSTSSIVLTEEGVVIIDTGQTLIDSREVMQAVRKLTNLPVRIVINTEVHPDHTTGNFVFSPPPSSSITSAHPMPCERLSIRNEPHTAKQSPEMREAVQGYRLVTPHVEYQNKTTLRVGERTFELIHMRGVHSEADTAVWLPNERVFRGIRSASRIDQQHPTIRPDPRHARGDEDDEIFESGYRRPWTRFVRHDEDLRRNERYYTLLLERVGTLVRAGRTLEQVKQELRMPDTPTGRTRSGCRAMSRQPTGRSPHGSPARTTT